MSQNRGIKREEALNMEGFKMFFSSVVYYSPQRSYLNIYMIWGVSFLSWEIKYLFVLRRAIHSYNCHNWHKVSIKCRSCSAVFLSPFVLFMCVCFQPTAFVCKHQWYIFLPFSSLILHKTVSLSFFVNATFQSTSVNSVTKASVMTRMFSTLWVWV